MSRRPKRGVPSELLPLGDGPTDADESAVRRLVARSALDRDDCRFLLDALGLLPSALVDRGLPERETSVLDRIEGHRASDIEEFKSA